MRKILLLMLFILISFPFFIHAGKDTSWKLIGPDGGKVVGLAFNPKNKKQIYALTTYAVYRSNNAGGKWKEQYYFGESCLDVQVAPSDPKIIYVLGQSKVFRSADSGKTWQPHGFKPDYFSEGQIAVHSKKPDTIYVGGYSVAPPQNKAVMVVMKSRTGGEDWTIKTVGKKGENSFITTLIINPKNPDILYAGGYAQVGYVKHGKLYKSINGNKSWENITGVISLEPASLAINPKTPSKIIVGTTWGIYRSSDSGKTFKKQEGYVYGYMVAIDPVNPDTVYAGYSESCYKSTDGGANWKRYISNIDGECQKLIAYSNKVYFASNSGLYKSIDYGVNWNPSHRNIYAQDVLAVAVSPSLPSTLYVSAEKSGLYRTTNSGQSWVKALNVHACDTLVTIAVHPYDSKALFCLFQGTG